MVAVVPYKWVFRRHLEDFIQAIGEPATVLEAGCALGKFSERFPRARYVGTTFSASDLIAARELLPEREFLLADLGQVSSLPRSDFDLVICTHTISYVERERLATAVENLLLSTASDGHVVVQFTEDDAPALLPIIGKSFQIIDHRRYGGRLLSAASKAGVRLKAGATEGIRGVMIRVLNRIDTGREFHVMLLRPLSRGMR
jgi:SAM-dependent methyltransferase